MPTNNIPIKITRKNIKNMYIQVLPPNATVKVSIPKNLSDEEICDFIESHKDWIEKKRRYILENKIQAPLKYKSGETHCLWGEKYILKVISNEKVKDITVNNGIIYLPVSKRSTIKSRKKALNEFYRLEMKKNIPPLLNKCINIVGKQPNEVKIRDMKNWGNCHFQDKRITLNLKLATKPRICLEYVIIHELTHLIEFNHSKNFKKLMEEFLPNWREIKELLNK